MLIAHRQKPADSALALCVQHTAEPYWEPYGFWVKGSWVALHLVPWRQTGTCAELDLHTHMQASAARLLCAHSPAMRKTCRSCLVCAVRLLSLLSRGTAACVLRTAAHLFIAVGFLYELSWRNPGPPFRFSTTSWGWSETQRACYTGSLASFLLGKVTCSERITNTANRGSWNVLLGPLLVFVGARRAAGNRRGKWLSHSLVEMEIFSLGTSSRRLRDWSAACLHPAKEERLPEPHASTFLRHVHLVYNRSNH